MAYVAPASGMCGPSVSSRGAQAAPLMRLAENLQEKLECTDFQVDLESTYAVEVDNCFVFVVLSCDFTGLNNGVVLRYIECGMVLSGHSILFRFTYPFDCIVPMSLQEDGSFVPSSG